MKVKSMIKGIGCTVAAAAFFSGSLLLAVKLTPSPDKLPRLGGGVTISVRPYNTFLSLSVLIRRGSKPVSGLQVALNGQSANESDPGRYRCEISGFTPTAGSRVIVTIAKRPGSGIVPGWDRTLTATATIGSLCEFSSPKPDAHFPRNSIRPLTVSWSGGNPPYGVTIYPFLGKDEVGEAVFEQSGIAGTSVAVPMDRLRRIGKYGIYLSSTMEEFRFNQEVDPDSRFILRQSLGTYIFIE